MKVESALAALRCMGPGIGVLLFRPSHHLPNPEFCPQVASATLIPMNTAVRKRGFTLVEILIVVAIIATLASVALVGLGPVQRNGRDTRRISDLRQTQNAIELYYAKCGFYPGQAQEDNTDCLGAGGGISGDWADLEEAIVGTYSLGVSKVPDDPRSDRHYFYGSANGSSYVVGALLENEGAAQLRDDEDGTQEGVDCEDPVYCIRL